MQLSVNFPQTHFGADVLEEAINTFETILPEEDRPIDINTLSVASGNQVWTFDTREEFLSEYRKPHASANIIIWGKSAARRLQVTSSPSNVIVAIKHNDRPELVRLMGVFERHVEASRIPDPPVPPEVVAPRPRLFIGHGGSRQWRDLKDHLQDSHGYEVEAYETGARAGHVVRDILEEMLQTSSFALLIHTGEDETSDGVMRARQNVIHETGLFQGRLGFGRAIVLLEDGVENYSNLQGVHQIKYNKGNIKETFGEVLATLRREFGP